MSKVIPSIVRAKAEEKQSSMALWGRGFFFSKLI
jgi:hypothetical protein